MSVVASKSMGARFAAVALLGTALAGCNDSSQLASGRAWRPISSEMQALFANKGTDAHQPTLIRTFKKEAEFEIWKMRPVDGKYVHVKTFPMCRWSGQLGPKTREGDRQVPEGFYDITPGHMNPNSSYYLSFNVGYPNAYDRAYGRDGGSIMVHGACSSAGCFSMTDAQIADIYAVARESFGGGQRSIQMESFPFRMTADNLAKHRLDPNIAFWKNLKEGNDNFEVTKAEPAVGVCNRKYVFNAGVSGLDPNGPCPALRQDETRKLVAEKQGADDDKVAALVAKGVQPVRVVYADGGQHPDFAHTSSDVSRPDALAAAPTEIALQDKAKSPLTKLAAAKAAKAKADVAKLEAVKPETIAARSEASQTVDTRSSAATGTIGTWMGTRRDEPAPAAETAEPEPKTAAIPTPPKRGASVHGKPQASLETKTPFYGARDADKNFVALEPVRR